MFHSRPPLDVAAIRGWRHGEVVTFMLVCGVCHRQIDPLRGDIDQPERLLWWYGDPQLIPDESSPNEPDIGQPISRTLGDDAEAPGRNEGEKAESRAIGLGKQTLSTDATGELLDVMGQGTVGEQRPKLRVREMPKARWKDLD